MAGSTIQSIERAFDVLEYFNINNKEVGVTELSKKININKSTLHGIMKTLVQRNYLKQNENNKYMLGTKLLELGVLVQKHFQVTDIPKKYLKDLVNKHKETVHVAVLEGNEVVFIDKLESSQSIRMVSEIGKRLPAHSTALGKVLLAHLPDKEKKQFTKKKLKKVTFKTITDPDQLLEELDKIKEKGYAFDDEEVIKGVRCVSAPIRNHSGEVVAALSISGPAFRMDSKKTEELSHDIVKTAEKISQELGYAYN